MTEGFETFLALPQRDRRDVIEAAASRLDTSPSHVEKDFWVCLVLEMLFNHCPKGHPRLLFKGGTSLSKVFGLIERFSEDIDLVVFRDDLGFEGECDPATANNLSNKKRDAQFTKLRTACSEFIRGDLRAALARQFEQLSAGCRIVPDESDPEGQTLLVEYPTLYPSAEVAYVAPRVKIEAGARSALDPNQNRTVTAYIADELPGWSFKAGSIRVIAPERTYWEKLLILHGTHCGFRDQGRVPKDSNRISRHYYDAAMITATEVGRSALADIGLLDAVRDHNLVAFPQAWKRFKEAVPGSIRLAPQIGLREVIERDYQAMQGMILGDPPDFEWITEQLQHAEAVINGT